MKTTCSLAPRLLLAVLLLGSASPEAWADRGIRGLKDLADRGLSRALRPYERRLDKDAVFVGGGWVGGQIGWGLVSLLGGVCIAGENCKEFRTHSVVGFTGMYGPIQLLFKANKGDRDSPAAAPKVAAESPTAVAAEPPVSQGRLAQAKKWVTDRAGLGVSLWLVGGQKNVLVNKWMLAGIVPMGFGLFRGHESHGVQLFDPRMMWQLGLGAPAHGWTALYFRRGPNIGFSQETAVRVQRGYEFFQKSLERFVKQKATSVKSVSGRLYRGARDRVSSLSQRLHLRR